MTIRRSGRLRRGGGHRGLRSFEPSPEPLEPRQLLSFADGNGPVVAGLTEQTGPSGALLVVSFDGPLNATRAQQVSNFAVKRFPPSIPEIVTTVGPADPIRAASYDAGKFQVTLTLARPLAVGVDYRVWINGTPGSGLTDINGVTFDGDNDDTPGGNFYGLLSVGRRLSFTDLNGDRAMVGVSGGGVVELWRELDGDVDVLTVVGAVTDQTILTGSVRPAKGSDGLVVIPSIQGITGASNQLPPSFVSQAPPSTSPSPVVATLRNLAYSFQIKAVSMPSVPAIQSAVFAQAGGKWLLFGGRTNGLHGFDPSGLVNFPPDAQNNDIIVIDPTTGQTWTMPWSATGLDATVTASLSSSNQEFYQSGDRLYTVGGYSSDPITNRFTTYDTLSAIKVSGLINAVINSGNAAAQVKQIQDSRLQVTGGELDSIGSRSYLVFGQDFEGGYNGSTADYSQIYTDEIRSFRIIDHGNTLAITGYQAQRDPVNFRRRDYNLGPTILPCGRQGLTGFGGVFTPAGNGYRYPVLINLAGKGQVDTHYQQYFSQYTTAKLAVFDAKNRSMDNVFFGGIGLYSYNFATGTLTMDTGLPFVNDVTTLVQRADGSDQEYMMPSQLPGRYGAEARFFVAPGIPQFSDGVIKLNQLKAPTTLGYIYGGIYSTVGNTTDPSTQTTSSNQVFQVTLIPN